MQGPHLVSTSYNPNLKPIVLNRVTGFQPSRCILPFTAQHPFPFVSFRMRAVQPIMLQLQRRARVASSLSTIFSGKSRLPQPPQDPSPGTPSTDASTNSSATPTSTVVSTKSIAKSLLGETNPRTQVKKFKKYSESDRFRRSLGVYEAVVRRLSNLGHHKWIEEILEDQKKYKDVQNEGFCIRLMSLYGKSKMFDHAKKVFDEMPVWNCTRTVNSLNVLLAAGVNAKQFDKVQELFRDLPEKLSIKTDVVSYNIMIKALCEKASLDSAASMLDEMEKDGLKPDLITFNTILHGFYGNKRLLEGDEIWDKMEKYGVYPDVRSYNAKFTGLASGENVKETVGLLEEMKKKKLMPNSISFTLIMKCCRNTGNVEEAKTMYHRLRKIRCTPSKGTYAVLLPFACEMGDLDFAFLCCENIVHERCLVDGAVLQKVVDELAKSSKLEEAKKVVQLGNSNKFYNFKLKLPSLGQSNEASSN